MIDRIKWGKTKLAILDQRLLPDKIVYLNVTNPQETARAITDMVTRGAPLIGCTAAYGYALALKGRKPTSWQATAALLGKTAKILKEARPTAIALAYAVDRLHNKATAFIEANKNSPLSANTLAKLAALIDKEAQAVYQEDVDANERLSELGSKLIKPGSAVMTICNAGALATAGMGTALGVITRAFEKGRVRHVYALETRPYLQGARLTMFELMRSKIPAQLITDNMAAHIMKTCGVSAIVAGADRIAANGDTANKIGTYMLGVLAKYHNIPLYIAAPKPTFDLSIPDGDHIPIEERSSCEVTEIRGHRITPKGATARHPAFDVTPGKLIAGIITEYGIISPVNRAGVKKIIG